MTRRKAGADSFDADQAWRQLLEECQQVAALQLASDDHLASGINAVDLKDRFRNIETDCRIACKTWLLRIVGALTAPTSMALTCRVEEPSTASQADIPSPSATRPVTAAANVHCPLGEAPSHALSRRIPDC